MRIQHPLEFVPLSTCTVKERGAAIYQFERPNSIECDSVIQQVYPYRAAIAEVHGRAGPTLRPPLESSFLRKMKADLVIFFTDGYGPAPEQKPQVPVIWCLTPGGELPAAWGRDIRMT